MHVRCGNQYKTRADRGTILGQSRLCECLDICGLSPAHESEMRDLPSLSADCKILIWLILFKFSHSILDWTALSWIFFSGVGGRGGGFLKKHTKEGSVDHIIYRDYTANRSSCIYWSLACNCAQYLVSSKCRSVPLSSIDNSSVVCSSKWLTRDVGYFKPRLIRSRSVWVIQRHYFCIIKSLECVKQSQ